METMEVDKEGKDVTTEKKGEEKPDDGKTGARRWRPRSEVVTQE